MAASETTKTTKGSRPRNDGDTTLSGSTLCAVSSARAGYIPVSLERVPTSAFKGIATFIRAHDGFTLYRAADYRFIEGDRKRLLGRGVRFVYIQMADQARFRDRIEHELVNIVSDPAVALSEKSAILYETSVQLIDELISEPEMNIENLTPRLGRVTRAVTTLVMNEPAAFSHLFAASHHDFYTATHMVNVGTWMVALAYSMGRHDPDELSHICGAGLLHDMGKLYIPEEILNKKGRLDDAEWQQIRKHPELGYQHLEKSRDIDPLALTVTLQHHERLDGTGYPHGLPAEKIHPISRICAVVDSFDAMTAFRPFKDRTMSIEEAMTVLESETPEKYDADVMAAWKVLVKRLEADGVMPDEVTSPQTAAGARGSRTATRPLAHESGGSPCSEQREYPRYAFQSPARVHVLNGGGSGQVAESPGVQVTTHNISRGGIGFLSQFPFALDEHVRIYLLPSKGAAKMLEGRTVRCRAYSDGWHDIGIQLTAASNLGAAA